MFLRFGRGEEDAVAKRFWRDKGGTEEAEVSGGSESAMGATGTSERSMGAGRGDGVVVAECVEALGRAGGITGSCVTAGGRYSW